jgi:hypothetical protein
MGRGLSREGVRECPKMGLGSFGIRRCSGKPGAETGWPSAIPKPVFPYRFHCRACTTGPGTCFRGSNTTFRVRHTGHFLADPGITSNLVRVDLKVIEPLPIKSAHCGA